MRANRHRDIVQGKNSAWRRSKACSPAPDSCLSRPPGLEYPPAPWTGHDARSATAPRRWRLPGTTFVTGRCSRDFWVSSRVRTHAQTCAEVESPCVRVPYGARCELHAATPPRTAAHIQYRRRYRSAFAHVPPRSGALVSYLVDEDSGTAHRLTVRA